MKEFYKFRPSARIIHTIGDNIIKDVFAAIVELVKNAYDADSPKVEIKFIDMTDRLNAKIIIKDYGHGMDFDTVKNVWMVPSTIDKIQKKQSINGRKFLGRKGIGRFAAAILGNCLFMETTDKEGNTTKINIDWNSFQNENFLDEVNVMIESENTKRPSGTELTIKPFEKIDEWNESVYEKLLLELRKLISPINKKEDFEIRIEFKNIGIDKLNNKVEKIEPFPLLELFDYKLSGKIDDDGKAILLYENQVEKKIPSEHFEMNISLEKGKYCGPISIDFRVFDRDPESIDKLIQRGLKDLSKKEARELLNNQCGIAIYIEDFRIRPYGEPGYDWLLLDKLRVQNPSMKIGVDQIIGIVNIEKEEISHLEETSARDGLKDNEYYKGLIEILRKCLIQLEQRRFDFRRKTGRGRKNIKIEKELVSLFDFNNLKKSVKDELNKSNISSSLVSNIENIISETEKEKSSLFKEIKETIAIYQGQATLGKIIMVIMHEGRKPLKYLKEQSPMISEWISDLKKIYETDIIDKIIDRLSDIKKESLLLIELFNKLDPLATKKRGKKNQICIFNVVEKIKELFNNELHNNHISLINDVDKNINFYGWEQDLYICLTNLVDNSLYWLNQKKCDYEKKITISSKVDEDIIIIEYRDNGPGIEKNNIENELIFEPGFSTKLEGTGLGLPIAGESIERNEGKLEVIYNTDGAYFRISLKKGENNDQ